MERTWPTRPPEAEHVLYLSLYVLYVLTAWIAHLGYPWQC